MADSCSIDGSCCGVESECCAQGALVRDATLADYDRIASLLSSTKLPLAGVRECIADFVVAEKLGDVVASIAIERHGDFGLLRSAAVSSSLRGQGLGTLLVDRALEKAREQGLRQIFLLTTTAQEYFPRFGFSRVDRSDVPLELHSSAELTGACPDSATVMRKTL